jgi:hypothetical protein
MERQVINTSEDLHERITRDPGRRPTEVIDGAIIVTGADGKRYEVASALIAPLVAAHARLTLPLDTLAREPRTEEQP